MEHTTLWLMASSSTLMIYSGSLQVAHAICGVLVAQISAELS